VYLAVTLSSLGDVYAAMGDYDKALENLMKALDTSRKRMTPMGPQVRRNPLAGSL